MTRALLAIDKKSTYKLLCLDPSIRNLGWAWFHVNEFSPDRCKLLDYGVVKARQENWMDAMDHMLYTVEHEIMGEQAGGEKVVIEQPIVFGGGSARGDACQNSSAMIKLAAVAFSIRTRLFSAAWNCSVDMVPVNKWKGTVPKEITARRIARWWKVSGLNHNAADAIGIGDWYIRKHLRLDLG